MVVPDVLDKFFQYLSGMRKDYLNSGDPYPLSMELQRVDIFSKVSGIMKAYLLKTLIEGWHGDGDIVAAVANYTGYAVSTVDTYYKTAMTFEAIKERVNKDTWDALLSKDMADQIRIGQYEREHGLTDAKLHEVASTFSRSALLDVLGRKQPESERILITEDNEGRLRAHLKGKKAIVIGLLNTDETQEHAKAAIERIRRTAGIVRKA